jgi:hypothetical protein
VQPVVVLHAHTPGAAQLVPAPHTLPQPPQLALLVFGSTHAPEHALRPVLQRMPHVGTVDPAGTLHDALPLAAGGWQTFAQLPQLFGSTCSLTHAPVHKLKPGLHPMPQTPAVHDAPELAGAVQTFPQAPQSFVLVCSSTHAPTHGLKPVTQRMPHTPAAQDAVPFVAGGTQLFPHIPQLLALVCSSTHTPLHEPKPVLHAIAHIPATHVALPFVGMAQGVPQPPQ